MATTTTEPASASAFNEQEWLAGQFGDKYKTPAEIKAELEQAEQARTGIRSLKVRYTGNFGYYIEVTKANLAQVPGDYIRKQTMVNAERFTDLAKTEKWFRRNCDTVLGRECTVIEKGNFLTFMSGQ